MTWARSSPSRGTRRVTVATAEVRRAVIALRLPDDCAAWTVTVAGDLTAWVPLDMPRDGNGDFSIDVTVPRHRRWHYRFCVDDTMWINDPEADDYEGLADGSAWSVRLS